MLLRARKNIKKISQLLSLTCAFIRLCVSITWVVNMLSQHGAQPQSMQLREMGLRPRNLQFKACNL